MSERQPYVIVTGNDVAAVSSAASDLVRAGYDPVPGGFAVTLGVASGSLQPELVYSQALVRPAKTEADGEGKPQAPPLRDLREGQIPRKR